jgi:hypothetical protein
LQYADAERIFKTLLAQSGGTKSRSTRGLILKGLANIKEVCACVFLFVFSSQNTSYQPIDYGISLLATNTLPAPTLRICLSGKRVHEF